MDTESQKPLTAAGRLARVRRGEIIRCLLQRDKTPLVGTLTGLVAVTFERALNGVMQYRLALLAGAVDSGWLIWPLAFALSAMLGYWLVRRFAPEAGGSGIPEIEGALEEMRPVRWWRVLPVSFLAACARLVPEWSWGVKG